MQPDHSVSRRALLTAVVVALLTGVLASLAIRPPGQAARQQGAAEAGSTEVIRWRAASSFNCSSMEPCSTSGWVIVSSPVTLVYSMVKREPPVGKPPGGVVA